MIQADPKFRLDEASLNNAFVRMSNGEMAPLSQFVTLTRSYGAESLSRFNMFNSIAVNAMPAEGYSTGDAIRAVQETAEYAIEISGRWFSAARYCWVVWKKVFISPPCCPGREILSV